MEQPDFSALSSGMQHQLKIYFEGMQNKKASVPVSFEELEKEAKKKMSPEAFDYIAGSAGSEITTYNNQRAFNDWQIVPRMMGDVSKRRMSVDLFGIHLPSPLLLGPIGVLSIAHPGGEVAVAKAAIGLRVPEIVSTVSSQSLEEIAAVHGNHPHWFQLYWEKMMTSPEA